MDTIKEIAITELKAHPDNPRLFMREDVIKSITNQLKSSGAFDPAHALLVRPFNGHYQIIQGHHRIEAAKQAGLDTIPCWVRQMDDDEAYMQLALGNAEDGLGPLEWGKHALGIDRRSKLSGGLQKYAELIGQQPSHLSTYRKGAEVLLYITNSINGICYVDYTEKAQHLAAIHKIKEYPELWPLLAQEMLNRQWSAQDTSNEIDKVKKFLESVPGWWQVDKASLVMLALDNKHKGAKSAFELAAKVEKGFEPVTIYFLEKTDQTEMRDGREYCKWIPIAKEYDPATRFRNELNELAAIPDKKEVNHLRADILAYIQRYSTASEQWTPILTDEEWTIEQRRQEELARIAKRERFTPRLMCCDVLEGLRRIASESIDLICIDPPYNIGKASWDELGTAEEYTEWAGQWLAECYRVLKLEGSLYIFGRFEMLRYVSVAIEELGFALRREIIWDTIQGSGGPGLWPIRHESILYFTKTDDYYENPDAIKLERHEEHIREYKGKEYKFKSISTVWRVPCVDEKHQERTDHPTQKPFELMERIILASSPPEGKVLDCFIGSGTTGVAAMKHERYCIGIDNNPAYIAISQARFDDTEVGNDDG